MNLHMNPEMSSEPFDTPPRRSANLSKGYSAIFATVFIWSVPSLFMYYLNRYYDPWAQNFYRYQSLASLLRRWCFIGLTAADHALIFTR